MRQYTPGRMTPGFLSAEASFLESLKSGPVTEAQSPLPPTSIDAPVPGTSGPGRKVGRPRGSTADNTRIARVRKALLQPSTITFFQQMLDDETEKRLWLSFITAKVIQLDANNQPVIGEDGFPVLENVELNPISWQAFKLAVAYKRGMPAIKVEDTKGKQKEFTLEVTYQGAGQDFFETQAKSAGLLK